MSKLRNKTLGITLGDPAGIGPEVIAASLRDPEVQKIPHIKIIGDQAVLNTYQKSLPENCEIVQVGPSFEKPCIGKPDSDTAAASLDYLNTAIQLLRTDQIHALVTAPLSKEGICGLGSHFHGHTEYLAKAFDVIKYGMMFVAPKMKTIIVTRHMAISELSKALTREEILTTIFITDLSLKKHFGIKKPKIAVCGLNPHAGEGGTIGKEEEDIITPALNQARSQQFEVIGPLAADTLFTAENAKPYDCIVAMYHDQGLIPIKSLYFHKLVNLTVGLPFIRTSPAHGTAFDIAGQNKANPSSMTEAIKLAATLK